MWLMAAPNPDRAVDITDTFDLKIAALRQHRSQVGEGEWLEERIRTWVEAGARAAGLGEGHTAELFKVVATP
jgi:LmbE family N-acetylglucosaminyl deacetylase